MDKFFFKVIDLMCILLYEVNKINIIVLIGSKSTPGVFVNPDTIQGGFEYVSTVEIHKKTASLSC